MKPYDLVGQKFGRLRVVENAGSINGRRQWLCVCSCGNKKVANSHALVSGAVKSCGCLNRDNLKSGNNRRVHGDVGTRLYREWKAVKRRCYSKNTKDYPLYGGRGIKVCEEWRSDYLRFKEWALKNGYDDTLSIDRINVDGDYEPLNCKWSTIVEQANNRRNNHFVTIKGETKTVTQWIRESGVPRSTVYQRLRCGVEEEFLFVPPKERKEVVKP